jgi:hypothetical protein
MTASVILSSLISVLRVAAEIYQKAVSGHVFVNIVHSVVI